MKQTTLTVTKAVALLGFLADVRREVGLVEAARELAIHQSTLYRLLRTLEQHKLVEQNPSTRRYKLGIRLIELGHAYLESIELRTLARPVLERLMQDSRETVHLMVIQEDTGVYIDRVDSPQTVRVASSLGRRERLHCSAVGKAILANVGVSQVTRILEAQGLPRFTANTITDPGVLLSHLEQARRLGYTIDDVEAEEGVRCVGAPVFDHAQDVIAAISIAGPAYRLPIEKLRRLGTRVRAAANEISASLGHGRPRVAPGRGVLSG